MIKIETLQDENVLRGHPYTPKGEEVKEKREFGVTRGGRSKR